jgi:predicted nucleic acid-binding protein
MSYLADTNVVARWIQPRDPLYAVARTALRTLRARNEQVYVTPQVVTEYWALATRPVAANGLGLTVTQVISRVRLIQRGFALLPDTPEISPAGSNL